MTDCFHLGSWKSIIEMEDNITIEELYALQAALYRQEHRRNRFAAALKGVDLDKESATEEEDPFERIKRKAEAELAGKSEQEFIFDMIGIEVDSSDDEDLPPAAPEVAPVEHPNYFDMIIGVDTDEDDF